MKVDWTDTALADLKSVVGFVAQHDKRAARRLRAAIADRVAKLAVSPRTGQPLSGYAPTEVRRLVVADHRVSYAIVGQTVYVLAVRHGRQQTIKDVLAALE